MDKTYETLRTYSAVDVTAISESQNAIKSTSIPTSNQEKTLGGDDVNYSHTELYEANSSHVFNVQTADKDFQERVNTTPELHDKLLNDFNNNPQIVKLNDNRKAEELDTAYNSAKIEDRELLEKSTYIGSEMDNKGVVSHTFVELDTEAITKVDASPEFTKDTHEQLSYKQTVQIDVDEPAIDSGSNHLESGGDVSKETLDNVPDFPEFDYAEIELNGSFRSEELDQAYKEASHEERLALDSDEFHYSRTEAYENGDVKHLFLDDTKSDIVRIDATEELAQDVREELKITKEEFFNSIDLPENEKLKRTKSNIEKDEDQVIDPSLDRKFTIVNRMGSTVYSYANDPSKVAIKENDSRISTKESNPEMVKNVLQIAEDKGWETIRLNGTKDFKREAWLEGNLRGLEVIGYAPTEQDLKKLERESEKRGVNLISEEKPTPANEKTLENDKSKITDLKEAMASLTKDEAVKKHPELQKVYEIEPSAVAFYQSQKNLPQNQENAFVRKATDRAIEELVKGKELPNFEQAAKEPKETKTEIPKVETINVAVEKVDTKQQRKDIDFD